MESNLIQKFRIDGYHVYVFHMGWIDVFFSVFVAATKDQVLLSYLLYKHNMAEKR